MTSTNYITSFDEESVKTEIPNKKISVIDLTAQNSIQQFRDQRLSGGIQNNICYSPENLDLIRWKTATYWNDAGNFGEQGSNPMWILGNVDPDGSSSAEEKKEIINVTQGNVDSHGLDSNYAWQWTVNSDAVPTASFGGKFDGQTIASVFGDSNPNNAKGKTFFDHVTGLLGVVSYSNINNRTFGSVRARYYDINPSYNFYIQDYEDALEDFGIQGDGIDEKTVPNMYAFLMVQQEQDPQDVIIQGDASTIDDAYEKHVTLNGNIEDVLFSVDTRGLALTTQALNSNPTISKASQGQYYDKYANSYSDFQDGGEQFTNLKNRFQNIIVPASDLNFYRDNDNKKTQFPMHIDIDFSTDINTDFSDALSDSQLSSVFIRDIVQSGSNNQESTGSFKVVDSTKEATIPETQSLNMWDITSWFNSLSTGSFSEATGSSLFLGPYNEEIATANGDSSFDFYKTLMRIAFAGRYEKLKQEKQRTFGEILNGKKAYSETAFYEVEKWSTDSEGNLTTSEPIQSIYLPNSREIDIHHYVDTQVRYNKNYLYRVKAYQAIFGTQYRYVPNSITPNPTAADSDSENSRSAEICVFTKPSIKLVEVPYFEKAVRVVDSPPISPDVEVIQYKDSRDEVLFFFRGNVGDYDLQPVAIEFGDIQKIKDVRDSQERPAPLPINFKSDDQARTFEVFRIDRKPVAYSDFLDNKIASIDTTYFDGRTEASSTSAAYKDSIQPNKKYYYTFRTIDVHGNVSNPSAVYQLEIIDNEGAPALVTEVVQINNQKPVPQSLTRKAKKYVRITPIAQQLSINEIEADLLNADGTRKNKIPHALKSQVAASYLGAAERTIWGNEYKIRIKSKKTGKQVDFNIKYKTKVNRPEDNGNGSS